MLLYRNYSASDDMMSRDFGAINETRIYRGNGSTERQLAPVASRILPLATNHLSHYTTMHELEIILFVDN
jgi:hypothetical protein